MKNKIILAVMALCLILIGFGISRMLFTPESFPAPTETKYERITDSLNDVIKEYNRREFILINNYKILDSIHAIKTIKYKYDVKKVKKFTSVSRLNYLDSLFRSEGFDSLPNQ